jgi:hypothetical protein
MQGSRVCGAYQEEGRFLKEDFYVGGGDVTH